MVNFCHSQIWKAVDPLLDTRLISYRLIFIDLQLHLPNDTLESKNVDEAVFPDNLPFLAK